jgi:hypothetical protein
MKEDKEALSEVADALGFAANRLADLAGSMADEEEPEHYGPGDAGTRRTEERGRWLKGAEKELALLIREIEGPNPPQAPRRPK